MFFGFVLVMSQRGYSSYNRAEFLVAIAMMDFFLTGILLALYLFSIPDAFKAIPWSYIELGYCLLSTILLGMSSLLLIMRPTTIIDTSLFTAGAVSRTRQKL